MWEGDSSAVVVCKMAASHVVKCRKYCFIIVSRVYAIPTILSNQSLHKVLIILLN